MPGYRPRVRRLAVLGIVLSMGAGIGSAHGGDFAPIAPWFPSGPPAREFLSTLPAGVHVDNFGNAWITRGNGSPHLLVLAHRDAPGWVVSQLTPDGYLRLQRLGAGPTPLIDQFLVGKRLVVYTRHGLLPAVATAPSTHFRRGGNLPVPEATVDDLWIDVGAESDDEARDMGVALLDPVTPWDRWPADDRAMAFHGARAAGVKQACGYVADLARGAGPPRGSVTYAWVAGGTEAARGSARLLATLGRIDSVIVFEPVPFAESDSTAREFARSGVVGVAPGDTAHVPSVRWAGALRATSPAHATGPVAPRVADARIFTAADIPTIVCTLPVAHAGSPAEYARVVSSPDLPSLGAVTPAPRVRGGRELPADAPWRLSPGIGTLHREAWRTIAPILSAYGVSEHERAVADAIRAQLPAAAGRAAVLDARGNLELRLGDGPPGRLFVAHQDEIGYRVTAVDPDGRARVERKGGFYDWLYEGESVRVAGPTQRPETEGIVAPRAGYRAGPRRLVASPLNDAVHPAATAASRFDVADVRVEVGADAQEALAPGSDVTVLHEMARLGAHRFAARAIDDRFGDAALVMAARELWPERHHLPNAVWLVWSVEEEIGLKGAQWLADSLAHHGALPIRVHAVDTFVSSDSPLENPRIGGARLGRGAVIRAVDTSHEAPPEAVRATLALARREDIPLQFGVTAGGNDGVPFAEHGSINVPLGWPLRSSHSAVEVADLRDLESLARLVRVLAEQPARDDPKRP